MEMDSIELDISNTSPFLTQEECLSLGDKVKDIHISIENRNGVGAEFLGWTDLASKTDDVFLEDINNVAKSIRSSCEVLIHIGIGGSSLGTRAGLTFLGPQTDETAPSIYFTGSNISSDYYTELFSLIKNKDCCLFAVSKSGTTLEFAIGFRLLRQWMEEKYGAEAAAKRIIVATDPDKGSFRKLADEKGYHSFVIPPDVGGRYSVLTPVGLFPMAVAGENIKDIMKGAVEAESALRKNHSIEANPAYMYAVCKYLLRSKGKSIELVAGFHPCLKDFLEWQKQLAGESEGKDGKGVFPASAEYPSDLHSLGQWVQDAERRLFETFLLIENSRNEINIHKIQDDWDGLNFLEGKSLDFINKKAYEGTAKAHFEGEVPNMALKIKDRSPRSLGQLFYFFQYLNLYY